MVIPDLDPDLAEVQLYFPQTMMVTVSYEDSSVPMLSAILLEE